MPDTYRKDQYNEIDIARPRQTRQSNRRKRPVSAAKRRKRRLQYLRRRLVMWLVLVVFAVFILNLVKKYKPQPIEAGTGTNIESNSEAAAEPTDNIPNEFKVLKEKYPDSSIDKIINNLESYPDDLLDLVLRNPETIEFVSDYHDYKDKDAGIISIISDYKEGEIPLFVQWDKRWGYEPYGTDMLALSGCGPTSMAMVAAGLTGDTGINPLSVSKMCTENNFVESNNSTSWALFTEGAAEFGLIGKMLPLAENSIKTALAENKPIIASMGPGDFTTTGHIIVLTGVDENGKIIVNDPNSRIRSRQTWDIEVFMSQSRNLWVYETKPVS